MSLFSDLPKIELHLHLDCSLSFDVVKKLKPSVSRDEYEENFHAPEGCADLKAYIKAAEASIDLMQTREQLELVTLDLFEQLKADNVVYAEIRFAPLQHLKKGLTPDEVVAVVNASVSKGIADTGIQAGIILCTLRHFSEEQSMQTVKLVEAFKDTHVVGFDIAADETLPVDNHVSAFRYAAEHNIHCTAHAGEARGAESVEEVLRLLKPSRIGHGIRSLESQDVIESIKSGNIHLEVCPTSNIQTGVYDDLSSHRITELYDQGVKISVNTDGRALSNVKLTDEYQNLHRHFHWNTREFETCNQNALDAAFASDKVKAAVRKKLNSGT